MSAPIPTIAAPPPESAYRRHYTATMRHYPDLTMDWQGRFFADQGTAVVARFETLNGAAAAGATSGDVHPDAIVVGVWPPMPRHPRPTGAWWIAGQDEEGAIEPGGYPFMVCRALGLSPYESVCMNIQHAEVAHLIAAAPKLRSALKQATRTMLLLRGALMTGMAVAAAEAAHDATHAEATRVLALAEGRHATVPEELEPEITRGGAISRPHGPVPSEHGLTFETRSPAT